MEIIIIVISPALSSPVDVELPATQILEAAFTWLGGAMMLPINPKSATKVVIMCNLLVLILKLCSAFLHQIYLFLIFDKVAM